AAALQSSGEALGGVVQAHRSDSRHDQPPVPVRTDRGPLHVVVQAEAVAATALLLEPGCADAAAGAFADERFHPVLPRLVCVEERGLEGIGRHGTPPRADPLDSVAVVAFELIPALLDGGLGGDLDDAPGLLPRRLLGPPEGDELVDDELPPPVGVELRSERVVVGPAGSTGVLGEDVDLRAGRVEGEPVRAEASGLACRHRFTLPSVTPGVDIDGTSCP